jgi:hypothetical protein
MLALWEHPPLSKALPPQTSDKEDDDRRSKKEQEPARRDDGQAVAAASRVYKVRAPRGPCSPRTEYSRTERPVCWERGGVGDLRRGCLQRFPHKKIDVNWRNKQTTRRRQFHHSYLLITFSACRKSMAMTVYAPKYG